MRLLVLIVILLSVTACAMTPEQRQRVAAVNQSNAQIYHPYMLPQAAVPATTQQRTTTTNCSTVAPGQVSCTSQSY